MIPIDVPKISWTIFANLIEALQELNSMIKAIPAEEYSLRLRTIEAAIEVQKLATECGKLEFEKFKLSEEHTVKGRMN